MGLLEMIMNEMQKGIQSDRMVTEWGITYIGNAAANGGMLPEPGNFILKDIRDWKKIIKAPAPLETSDSWWADKAKKDIAESGIDRSQSMAAVQLFFQPFTTFVGFMGFTEGLCALAEEPEEAKELFDWQLKYYLPALPKIVKYYEPELLNLGDDTATRFNPFISLEMYRDIFKPVYAALSKPFTDAGCFVQFHNCGRSEDFIPDMVDFGVRAWEPAQTDNDLIKVKTTYPISVCGGYDFVPPADNNITEELVRESVRKAFAKYAPGGRYSFSGGILTPKGDPKGPAIMGWMQDEAGKLADRYYDK
jgi:hypothetical protein